MLERQNISTLAKFHSAWGVSVNEEQVIGEDFSQKLKFRFLVMFERTLRSHKVLYGLTDW